jgi:hypothetical protein
MGLQMGQQFLNQHTDQLKAKAQRKYCVFVIFLYLFRIYSNNKTSVSVRSRQRLCRKQAQDHYASIFQDRMAYEISKRRE